MKRLIWGRTLLLKFRLILPPNLSDRSLSRIISWTRLQFCGLSWSVVVARSMEFDWIVTPPNLQARVDYFVVCTCSNHSVIVGYCNKLVRHMTVSLELLTCTTDWFGEESNLLFVVYSVKFRCAVNDIKPLLLFICFSESFSENSSKLPRSC